MDGKIHPILLSLFFFTFPATIRSKDLCPTSSCGKYFVPITHPFKLESDQPPKNCPNFINLKCIDDGRTMINLPDSGEFYVSYISYYTRKISLTDPENCLARRLMTNFSYYPLKAINYVNYTFYTCPRESADRHLSDDVIRCLSNSTNATIAKDKNSNEYLEERYGCKPIVSSLIPTDYNDFELFDEIKLTWNVPPCKSCKQYGIPASGRSWQARYAASPLFIPSLIAFAIIFIIFLLCLAKRVDRIEVNSNFLTLEQPPHSASATTSAPRQGGMDDSEINICTEMIVLRESRTNPGPDSHACPICLELYLPEDVVRRIAKCEHCFHSHCVELWLRKNITCPVCRTALPDVKS
ncbi:putative RING-H2 finger protein ATL21A isoform X2 [Primulina tabacum]|uniref:putative RING-H2 finger protein ATL21A isoform X2 n=1 Tax=Primulina tabacum TaxID=48773 RepID=UPI003F5A8CAC